VRSLARALRTARACGLAFPRVFATILFSAEDVARMLTAKAAVPNPSRTIRTSEQSEK